MEEGIETFSYFGRESLLRDLNLSEVYRTKIIYADFGENNPDECPRFSVIVNPCPEIEPDCWQIRIIGMKIILDHLKVTFGDKLIISDTWGNTIDSLRETGDLEEASMMDFIDLYVASPQVI